MIDLKLNDRPLDVVQSYNCLGNVINPIGNFNGNVFKHHPEYLCKQARKAIFNILNKIKQIGDMPPKYMFFLYQSMVQPILLYGSEIWGCQKKAC